MPSRLTVRDFALAFALAAIFAFFAWVSPQFLSPRNLSLLLIELSITATLALGMLLVILPGHIDLSAGSGVGLLGGVAATLLSGTGLPTDALGRLHDLLQQHFGPAAAALIPLPPWPPLGAMAFAVAIALLLWTLMGSLIVRQRIPAFIITLGGLLVFKGIFWLVIESHTVPVTTVLDSQAAARDVFLHLGDFHLRLWHVARDSGGFLQLFACWNEARLPILSGSGNLFSLLTSAYFSPLAGYALAALAVAGFVLTQVRAVRQRRRYGLAADDNELVFLRLFIAAQLVLLLVVITNQFRGLPLAAVILAATAAAISFLVNRTTFGRYLYAIGGNEEAAIVSGIPVQRITITAFALMGLVVALTGFMQTAYAGAATTTVGDLMELDAVAACVIGGVSLRGGRGTVLGVLFGALIMACLINGMTLLAVRPEHRFIARGAVLVLAVWLDTRVSRKSYA